MGEKRDRLILKLKEIQARKKEGGEEEISNEVPDSEVASILAIVISITAPDATETPVEVIEFLDAMIGNFKKDGHKISDQFKDNVHLYTMQTEKFTTATMSNPFLADAKNSVNQKRGELKLLMRSTGFKAMSGVLHRVWKSFSSALQCAIGFEKEINSFKQDG